MKTLLIPTLIALTACSASKPSKISVTNIWAQPLDKSATSVAVYMTVAAECTQPDVLRSIETAPPQKAVLRKSSVVANSLKLDAIGSVPIACDHPTMLKPMSVHVVITGLPIAVKIGSQIPLTLLFDEAGKIDTSAEVTSMAVLDNVDPMHMNVSSGSKAMSGMKMP